MKKTIIITLLTLLSGTLYSQSLKEAIRLNENEQQEAAAAMYQQLLLTEPNNGTLYYYYGENFIDAENPEKAVEAFQKGLEKDPMNPLNLIGQAEIKLMAGDLAGAKLLIDKAVMMGNGKNALVLMEAGEAYIQYRKTQDLMSAQNYLTAAAKLEPKNPEVYNLLGDLYSELNNGTEAAINYNKALDLDKTQVKGLLHKGQLYKRATNFDGAIIEFENAKKLDPNFAPAYRELGEVYFRQKKIEEAKASYKKYLELSKNNTFARLRYAFFLFDSEDFSNAQAELNLVNKVDSSNLYMMRIMAYVAYEYGAYDTAYRCINKVFEITETDTSRRFGKDYAYYGKTLAKQWKDSLAIVYLEKAVSIDPRNSELYDDLAKMATKQKNYALAVKTYENKIANVAKILTADYFNLGKAYYSNKNFLLADSIFKKVTELSPNWPNGYLYNGRSSSQIDTLFNTLQAIPPYEKYIELNSVDSVTTAKYSKELIEANSYIAVAYLRKKDCDKSILYWKKVLAIDPKVQQAIDAIKIIKESKDCR
jgi:tetratricopeptide (TPR) repeat protein